MANDIADKTGLEAFDYFSRLLDLEIKISGIENVPPRGRVIITPNHPAGIADGIAVFDAIKSTRSDMIFVANRDALRVAPGMADIIIPVEWREEERTRRKTVETVRAIRRALESEQLVVLFPSGRLARPTITGLKERPWQITALNLARKSETPVVPMYIKGSNTLFYYAAWYIHTELKDMTLFRELLNKSGQKYEIQIGRKFDVIDDVTRCTNALRHFVINDLKQGSLDFNQVLNDGESTQDQTTSRRSLSY